MKMPISKALVSRGAGMVFARIGNRERATHPDQPDCFATAFTAADGTPLVGWAYRPEQHTAGTIFYQNGVFCHSMFLAEHAISLADRFGMVAACFDFRHHGLSGDGIPTIGYREGRDIQAALNAADRHNSPKPYILIGDSLGALATQWVAANDLRVNAAIMLEPPGWPWDAVGKTVGDMTLAGLSLGGLVSAGRLINFSYGEDVDKRSLKPWVDRWSAKGNPVIFGSKPAFHWICLGGRTSDGGYVWAESAERPAVGESSWDELEE